MSGRLVCECRRGVGGVLVLQAAGSERGLGELVAVEAVTGRARLADSALVCVALWFWVAVE
jgi:hypothetical protein